MQRVSGSRRQTLYQSAAGRQSRHGVGVLIRGSHRLACRVCEAAVGSRLGLGLELAGRHGCGGGNMSDDAMYREHGRSAL